LIWDNLQPIGARFHETVVCQLVDFLDLTELSKKGGDTVVDAGNNINSMRYKLNENSSLVDSFTCWIFN